MDFSGGVKHWDKCKLRTALEWVVFTSSRTTDWRSLRYSTLERIGSDSNLGLRVTSGLTLVLSRVRLIRVRFVLLNLNPINDTYILGDTSISEHLRE